VLQRIPAQGIYNADYGWYSGRFHFSYAEYEDPQNMNFGVLRALNEFVLQPDSGFDTHPHAEMEILSYCVKGELTHGDSLGNHNTITTGDVQYLSAGSGITHSEKNEAHDRTLSFYQIWITPKADRLKPGYDCKHFSRQSSPNRLLHLASGAAREGVIQIAQDANVYAARLVDSEKIVYTNWADRQSYLACLEGNLTANDMQLHKHDALKVKGDEILNLSAPEECHFLLVEMASDK
jgi:quercetin 2,3-dioxygenase